MKKFILLLIVPLLFSCGGSDKKNVVEIENEKITKEYIVFKCGNKWLKKDFINTALRVLENENFWNCSLDIMSKHMTLKDVQAALKDSAWLFKNLTDKVDWDEMLSCLKYIDDDNDIDINISEEELDFLCKREMMWLKDELGQEEYDEWISYVNLEAFFKCSYKEFLKEYGLGEVLKSSKKNIHFMDSDKFMNNIYPYCWNNNLK